MLIQNATRKDLKEAALNLSKADLEEFHMNIPGRDPVDVLPGCLDSTTRVIKVGAVVLAVGGSKDCLWFVTTTVVDQLTPGQRMRFYKILKGHLLICRTIGDPLTNFVSVTNKPHIRLLESLGATFSEGITMSPAGFAFRQFWL